MAIHVFPLPDLGEGLLEATIVEWLVEVGETVERDDPLAEVETTKSAVELPAPMAGTIVELHAAAGETVAVGAALVTFETPEQAGIVGTVPSEAPPRRRVHLRLPPDA